MGYIRRQIADVRADAAPTRPLPGHRNPTHTLTFDQVAVSRNGQNQVRRVFDVHTAATTTSTTLSLSGRHLRDLLVGHRQYVLAHEALAGLK